MSGIRLSHRVAIYVPSTTNVDQPTDTTQWIRETARRLAQRYGGATAQGAVGTWITDDGRLVEEAVTIVYAYAPTPPNERELAEFAARLREALRQEAVAVEVDRELLLIA